MQIYRIKKKDQTCYVTPIQFIEYKRKGRTIIKKLESRPNWTKEDRQKDKAKKVLNKYA